MFYYVYFNFLLFFYYIFLQIIDATMWDLEVWHSFVITLMSQRELSFWTLASLYFSVLPGLIKVSSTCSVFPAHTFSKPYLIVSAISLPMNSSYNKRESKIWCQAMEVHQWPITLSSNISNKIFIDPRSLCRTLSSNMFLLSTAESLPLKSLFLFSLSSPKFTYIWNPYSPQQGLVVIWAYG